MIATTGVAATSLFSRTAFAADPGEGDDTSGADKGKPFVLQAADPDAPKDPAVVAAQKQAALDAELAKKGKPVDTGPPVYQKWQFWAIVGGVVVGLAGAIFATTKVVHSIRGGDVAPCPVGYLGCYGEGR